MNITLSPIRMDEQLELTKSGDVLTFNGTALDFGFIAEGDVLPIEAIDCVWIGSDVTRQGGKITFTLLLPHGANAPLSTLFPDPIDAISDGPIQLPAYETEETV